MKDTSSRFMHSKLLRIVVEGKTVGLRYTSSIYMPYSKIPQFLLSVDAYTVFWWYRRQHLQGPGAEDRGDDDEHAGENDSRHGQYYPLDHISR